MNQLHDNTTVVQRLSQRLGLQSSRPRLNQQQKQQLLRSYLVLKGQQAKSALTIPSAITQLLTPQQRQTLHNALVQAAA